MSIKTYIIRFPNLKSRNDFQKALKETSEIQPSQVEFGEFLPDVIVKNISEPALRKIKRIVDPGTRFIEDFQHDLF